MRILSKNLLLNKNIMRRRTAPRQMPPPPQQQTQQRMPQPSIKSSQVFSTQQGQYQQPQQMDPRRQSSRGNQYSNSNDYGVENTSTPKMSLAQAITLITLRLGSVETKLMNGEIGSSVNSIDGESLEQFNERLNLLEEKLNSSSTNNYKQQIDQLAEAIIQSKHLSNSLAKDNKELKTELANLKKQFADIKNVVSEIDQLAKNNENKIFQMLNSTMNSDCGFDVEDEEGGECGVDKEVNEGESLTLYENVSDDGNCQENIDTNDEFTG